MLTAVASTKKGCFAANYSATVLGLSPLYTDITSLSPLLFILTFIYSRGLSNFSSPIEWARL